MKKPKNETNTAFVTRLMEVSPTGALSQLFILTAIEKYATACAKTDPKVFDSGLLNGEAWVSTAKWIHAELKAKGLA